MCVFSNLVFETQIRELTNDKKRLKDTIDDQNHLINELRNEVRGFDQRIQSSLTREREALALQEKFKEDIKSSTQKYSHLEQAYNSLLEGSRKDLKEKQNKYESLLELQKTKYTKELSSKEAEINHYNTELTNVRLHLEKKIDDLNEMSQNINHLKFELSSKEDYDTMKKELEKLNRELLETEIKKKEESQKLIGKTQEVENLKEGVNKKTEEINSLKKENEMLKKKLASPLSNEMLERYERERELLQQKVEALEYELERQGTRGPNMELGEKRQYLDRIDQMETFIMQLEGQIKDLEESNDYLKSKLKANPMSPHLESPISPQKDISLQYSPDKEMTITKRSPTNFPLKKTQQNPPRITYGLSHHAYLD